MRLLTGLVAFLSLSAGQSPAEVSLGPPWGQALGRQGAGRPEARPRPGPPAPRRPLCSVCLGAGLQTSSLETESPGKGLVLRKALPTSDPGRGKQSHPHAAAVSSRSGSDGSSSCPTAGGRGLGVCGPKCGLCGSRGAAAQCVHTAEGLSAVGRRWVPAGDQGGPGVISKQRRSTTTLYCGDYGLLPENSREKEGIVSITDPRRVVLVSGCVTPASSLRLPGLVLKTSLGCCCEGDARHLFFLLFSLKLYRP